MFGPSVQLEERGAGSKPVRGQAVAGLQLRPEAWGRCRRRGPGAVWAERAEARPVQGSGVRGERPQKGRTEGWHGAGRGGYLKGSRRAPATSVLAAMERAQALTTPCFPSVAIEPFSKLTRLRLVEA